MNKIDLDGRCAVVTGGAQGFGRAITERFVASGAKVAIWDHDQVLAEKTAKEINKEIGSIVTDSSRLMSPILPRSKRTRDETLKAFGKRSTSRQQCRRCRRQQDGVGDRFRGMAQGAAHQSRRTFHFCCKAIVPAMLKQKYGRIVNIASIAGKEGNPNAAHYSASKAGLIALTKSLGKELAAHDILVNAVDAGRGQDRDLSTS